MTGIIILFLIFWAALIALAIHLRCQEYNEIIILLWRRICMLLDKRNALLGEALIVALESGYAKTDQVNLIQSMRLDAVQIFDVKERGEFEAALSDVTKTFLQHLEKHKPNSVQHIAFGIEQIEADLVKARSDYNAVVKEMRFFLYTAPESFVARIFGFRPAEFYQIEQQLLPKK